MWQQVASADQTETTTDNLLSNGNFSSGLDSWTIEDSDKIKYDSRCYGDLCQSVRWSGNLGKTISQTIDNLDENYIIKNVNVSFTALGCNNVANTSTWCSQGTDYDKVQVTINLSDGVNQENLYLEQELDYNDGTLDYALTTSTLDSWLTQDTSINFGMTGIDTGNWSGQFGPIVDNINLNLDLETYTPVTVEPTVEPQVVVDIEPVVEVIEEVTMVEGLDLDTEVTLDIINDMDMIAPIPEATVSAIPEVDMASVEVNMDMDMDMDIDVEIDMEDMEIEEVEQTEQTEEIVSEETEIETASNESSNIQQPGGSDGKESSKKESSKKTATKSKDSKSSKPTAVAKTKAKATKSKSSTTKSQAKDTKTDGQLNQATLPVEYLQIITESITIQETISLTQEMIYGSQQEYNLNTSGITVAGLDNNSSSRWRNLQDERKRFKAPVYRKKSQ